MSEWSVFARTALGHYPVSVKKASKYNKTVDTGTSDKIYIYGFNIAGGVLSDEKGNSETLPNTASDNEEDDNTIADARKSYEVTIPAGMSGGKMTITVNAVQSLNNMNDNDASGYKEDGIIKNVLNPASASYNNVSEYCYNRQPNNINNNTLTDDFVIDVWDINPKVAVANTVGGKITQPVMSINQKDHIVGFAYANGANYFSMGGYVGSPNTNINASKDFTAGSYSTAYWLGGYDFWTSIGFTYDELGYSYGCTTGGDINGDGGVDRFRIMTDRWGRSDLSKYGYTNAYNSNRIECIGQLTASGAATEANIDKERIQSTSFATAVHGSETNVYLAYYDTINNEIRLKWGTFDQTPPATDTAKKESGDYNSARGNNPQIFDLFCDEYGLSNNKDGKSIINSKTSRYFRPQYLALIAGRNTNVKYDIGTTGANNKTGGNFDTGKDAGEYVSIAAIPNGDSDKLVAVWWDANAMLLRCDSITDPMSKRTKVVDSSGTTSTDGPILSGWDGVKTPFKQGIGEYCKVAIDKKGGIHIAAYDMSGCDVWYAYKAPDSDNFTSCIVDSYGPVGTEIGLDVAMSGTGDDAYPIPYITYYANNCVRPKVAYRVDKTLSAGAVSEKFTGSWEVSVVPTSSVILSEKNHYNIGLWKDAGVLNYSTKDGAAPNTSNIGESSILYKNTTYDAVNNSLIYGNGSKSAVLGYAIKQGTTGYIETAQKRGDPVIDTSPTP